MAESDRDKETPNRLGIPLEIGLTLIQALYIHTG
jgi:hypothetical protein